MTVEGPKPTGNKQVVDLAGMLIPWKNDQPTLVRVPGSTDFFIPIFKQQESLVATMLQGQIAHDKIKQIEQDSLEFLESVMQGPIRVKLMINPYFLANGKIRYTEIDPANLMWQ